MEVFSKIDKILLPEYFNYLPDLKKSQYLFYTTTKTKITQKTQLLKYIKY